ncbi:unnamed protein product [Protopolystoma xenopodis]|uniref:Uncharacterized protein n=1 Tax=Protopolystoma xenopodis TaxID=117903 RepID=A0A3S5C991_9PLAT|nr:unnamed protein product [Protopolystoma xenopodis]
MTLLISDSLRLKSNLPCPPTERQFRRHRSLVRRLGQSPAGPLVPVQLSPPHSETSGRHHSLPPPVAKWDSDQNRFILQDLATLDSGRAGSDLECSSFEVERYDRVAICQLAMWLAVFDCNYDQIKTEVVFPIII